MLTKFQLQLKLGNNMELKYLLLVLEKTLIAKVSRILPGVVTEFFKSKTLKQSARWPNLCWSKSAKKSHIRVTQKPKVVVSNTVSKRASTPCVHVRKDSSLLLTKRLASNFMFVTLKQKEDAVKFAKSLGQLLFAPARLDLNWALTKNHA